MLTILWSICFQRLCRKIYFLLLDIFNFHWIRGLLTLVTLSRTIEFVMLILKCPCLLVWLLSKRSEIFVRLSGIIIIVFETILTWIIKLFRLEVIISGLIWVWIIVRILGIFGITFLLFGIEIVSRVFLIRCWWARNWHFHLNAVYFVSRLLDFFPLPL